ncbi:hypothetical protein OG204_16100 [Streptomyces sp. NBC_01387]|uniref:hypothetical protein n=1 Tax=unclassified Streptomyces TaxID=2593676 RepID=UPI002024E855|nr:MULTISPECIES: hypothetical protein [unclassified Streptomyces]MCX4550106.1 hypothetical protein [Streptomyces sp. NBC_01500]WSC21601.1 hypothetical protein OIE60_19025 [Streptomyces sp. NBC_01766]WSV55564.1 hypothetical protein OG282_18725 [Streptomyces sp. NBC_01014]
MTTAASTQARTDAAHPVRSTIRAVKAFASAVFSVVILGEHDSDGHVVTRTR